MAVIGSAGAGSKSLSWLWPLFLSAGLGHVVLYAVLPEFWFWLAPSIYLSTCCVQWSVTRFLPSARDGITFGLSILRAFVFGAALGAWSLSAVLAHQLPIELDKHKTFLTFEVDRILDRDLRRVRMLVRVIDEGLSERSESQSLTGQAVILSWYSPPSLSPPPQSSPPSIPSPLESDARQLQPATNSPQPIVSPRAGQYWHSQVTLRRPRGMANPGGFDYAAWLLAQGVVATGYFSGDNAQLVGERSPTVTQKLYHHLQHKLKERRVEEQGAFHSDEALPSSRFFAALLLGDKTGLVAEDWEVLQTTGTVHLMAISGLHIGLVASLGFAAGLLLVRLWYRLGGPYLPWLYRLLPSVSSMVFAAFYAVLAGLSVPTLRALIACTFVNAALMLGARLSAARALAWGLAIVTFMEPFAWLQTGYWLSFAAVALLLALFSGSLMPRQPLVMLWRVQWQLCLLMTIALWLSGLPASIAAPLVNLLAVPFIAVLVPCLLFWAALSTTVFGAFLLPILDYIFQLMWALMSWAASFSSAAVWSPVSLTGPSILLFLFAGFAFLLPRSLGLRLAAVVVLALSLSGNTATRKHFELVALDVGQGLALVLHHPERTWLYDTGAHFSDRFNIGRQVILPYLKRQGVDLFGLIVSHADNDHRGGVQPLLEWFEPDQVLFGQLFEGLPQRAQPCEQGLVRREGRARYEVLWPPAGTHLQPKLLKANNYSCVLLVDVDGVRFLLPGDIEADVERKLLEQKLLSDIDVLVAPHHGSKSSSTRAFLEATQPQHIIVSAGYKNRYSHPHDEVLARYDAIGAKVWLTGQQGAIRASVIDGSLSLSAERIARPRPWY